MKDHIEDHIIVEDICRGYFPCKHRVFINGTVILMKSPDVAKLLREKGMDVPDHFSNYINWTDSQFTD